MLQSNMADDTMFVRVVNEMMTVIDFVEIGSDVNKANSVKAKAKARQYKAKARGLQGQGQGQRSSRPRPRPHTSKDKIKVVNLQTTA